jgi:Rieske Fe-S protein
MDTFDRRKFLQKALTATVLAVGSTKVLGKLIPDISQSGTLVSGTYTMNISQSPYTTLQQTWGSVLITIPGSTLSGSLLVTRGTNNQFYAVSNICTHTGCPIGEPIQSSPSGYIFTCQCHYSEFKYDGSVVQGPARRALTSYQTSYDGANTLKLLNIPGLTTGVAEGEMPNATQLSQNYPNPLSVSTTIEYALASPAYVVLILYSEDGREIMRLADGQQSAGKHQVPLQSTGLQSGTYFYTLHTSTGYTQSRRLIVTK